jgi:hypothetical protein
LDDRVEFEGSAVLWAQYEREPCALVVAFRSGRTYRYRGVPETVFDWLLQARSKGAYVNRLVKDRYPFEDISEPTAGATDLVDALTRSLE